MVIAVGCLTIALLIGVFFSTRPEPDRREITGSLSVIHCGYTNDAAGTRFAVFVVTNQSLTTYARAARYWIQTPAITRRVGTNISNGTFPTGEQTLQAGQSERLLLPAPTNQVTWRIYLFAKRAGAMRSVQGAIIKSADGVGQHGIANTSSNYFEYGVQYGIEGKWIDP